MSFLSYHTDYYRRELLKMETAPVDSGSVYKAKQLMKILDDLQDEGYFELSETLEKEIHGITRLRAYISNNGGTPFALKTRTVPNRNTGRNRSN